MGPATETAKQYYRKILANSMKRNGIEQFDGTGYDHWNYYSTSMR